MHINLIFLTSHPGRLFERWSGCGRRPSQRTISVRLSTAHYSQRLPFDLQGASLQFANIFFPQLYIPLTPSPIFFGHPREQCMNAFECIEPLPSPVLKNGCFPEAISLRSEPVAGKHLQRETGEGTDEDVAPLITSPGKKKAGSVILVLQYRRFRGTSIEPEERGREKNH